MAKGQMRSTREKKKPKKTAPPKAKGGAQTGFVQASGAATKQPGWKKP